MSWLGYSVRRTKVLFDDGAPWRRIALGAARSIASWSLVLCVGPDGLIVVFERWPELLDHALYPPILITMRRTTDSAGKMWRSSVMPQLQPSQRVESVDRAVDILLVFLRPIVGIHC